MLLLKLINPSQRRGNADLPSSTMSTRIRVNQYGCTEYYEYVLETLPLVGREITQIGKYNSVCSTRVVNRMLRPSTPPYDTIATYGRSRPSLSPSALGVQPQWSPSWLSVSLGQVVHRTGNRCVEEDMDSVLGEVRTYSRHDREKCVVGINRKQGDCDIPATNLLGCMTNVRV